MTTDTLDARTRTTDTVGAAERLGVEPETLRNWRWQGSGPPFVKMGRSVRYRLTDLADWLDERTRTSTSDDGSHA
jgi:predicted site-specific integrase-resolvase